MFTEKKKKVRLLKKKKAGMGGGLFSKLFEFHFFMALIIKRRLIMKTSLRLDVRVLLY